MPTYGYRCQSCSAEFEIWQRMTDEARASCPDCGAEGKRLFFPAGIVFKGGGFYKTDSRGSETAATAKTGGDKAPGKDGDKAAAATTTSDGAGRPSQSDGSKAGAPAPTSTPTPPTPAPSAPSGGSPPGKSA